MDIVEVASRIAVEEIDPLVDAIDRDGVWPEVPLRRLTARLGGLTVPAEYGGVGAGLTGLAQACETVGEHCASTALCFGMHCVASAVVAAKATPEQVERYLRPVVTGESITALALSEPGTGAHFWLPETVLRRAERGLIVDGRKTFVTSGGHADLYVVSANAVDGDGAGSFSCVAVPASVPGLSFEEAWDGIGMRGNSSVGMQLDQVGIDDDGLLGEEGDQIWYVFEVVAPYFLTAMAATYLGVARCALEAAREHLQERRYSHSGARLADQPILQLQLAELWVSYERTRALVYQAASTFDGNGDALVLLCAAKADAAGMVNEVVTGAMTLVGGIGYRSGGLFSRLLRNARAADVMSPTTNLLLSWIGRALLDRNLLVDPT